ncbi:MAG: T9SS type A sorting domain-containing protein [Bacteroidota bacterium]
MKNHFFLLALTLVLGANLKSQQMAWVPGNVVDNPAYTDGTDCSQNVVCYALAYTPAQFGVLTSYTTNFIVDCDHGASAVVGNRSLVMTDNSKEELACAEAGVMLLQSSGNTGTFRVKRGQTYYLHEICVQTARRGQELTFSADDVGSLTTSLDVPGSEAVTEVPSFAKYLMKRNTQFCDALQAPDFEPGTERGNPSPLDTEELSLELAPNPAVNEIRVSVLVPEERTELSILDAQGRTVQSRIVTTRTRELINVSQLPSGVYFLSVGPDYPELTRRFVINR